METYSPSSAWNEVRTLELNPIEGGPVVLEPTDLRRLFMIPWLITHSEAHPSLRFSEDPGKNWQEVEAIYSQEDEGFIVGHQEGGGRWRSLRDISDISTLLLDLPDGLEMELFTATDFFEGRQRYVGVVEDGKWSISRSHTKLDAATLNRAMEFCHQESIEMATEEEAQRAAEAAESEFADTFMGVLREGKLLTGLMEGKPDESVTLLLRAFAFAVAFEDGPWSFPEISEERTDEGEDLASLTAQLTSVFTQPDPEGERLIYAGKCGRFFSGDLLAMPHLIDRDPKILDEELSELGFQALGDLTCNTIYETVLRGYARGDGCYAVGQASYGGVFITEFYTAFKDGSSMTTSTNPEAENLPKKKIYRSNHCELDPEGLYRKHREAVAKHGQEAKTGPPTLEGLAEAIDEYMERQGPVW